MGSLERRGKPFQSGCRPLDTSAPTIRRSRRFESFAPSERLLRPTYRLPPRIRRVELGAPPTESAPALSAEEWLDAVVLAAPKKLEAQDLGCALRHFVADLPKSVANAVCPVPGRVAGQGPGALDPLCATFRVVFAVLTRASWEVRSD